MSIIKANNINFNTCVLGNGPPVAMVHGMIIGSMASWYFNVGPTLAKSHKVLLYDLRGHGKSEIPSSEYDLGTMCADLDSLLSIYFSQNRVSLVGHSFGGAIIIRYAIDHPEKLDRLVLVDVSVPPWDIYPLTHIEEYKPEEVLSMLPKYFQNVLFEKGRRTKRFLASMKRLGEKTSLLSDVEAENEIPDAKLKQIRCPTLCLYGNNSVCLPIGEHLARAIPNARLETVPGIHYLLSDESAVFVSERVEQFFRE